MHRRGHLAVGTWVVRLQGAWDPTLLLLMMTAHCAFLFFSMLCSPLTVHHQPLALLDLASTPHSPLLPCVVLKSHFPHVTDYREVTPNPLSFLTIPGLVDSSGLKKDGSIGSYI